MTGFEGTGALVRLAVRRDRVRLPAWLIGVSAVTYLAGNGMRTAFPTQASMDAYAASVASSPAVVAMSGPPIALDTLPGIVLSKVAIVTSVGVCLMALLEAVRHTRGEEEEGRTELLRSGVVGRHAGGAAALLVACMASAVLGVLVSVALKGASLPAGSAVLYGAGTAMVGMVFAGIGLCLSQVFTHARAATGAGLGLLGVAYVLRAAGDVRDDWLVWLSPIGWSQATHVLGVERWWPLLVSVAVTVLLGAVAVVLSGRRDVGVGLVASRDGSPVAGRLLSGPVGLAVRLQRGVLAGWMAGVFLLAVAMGSLTNAVEEMAKDNPALEKFMHATGQGSFVDAFLATMLLMVALIGSGFAVSSAMRLHSEEVADRVEPLLATGLSRTRWLLAGVGFTGVGSVLLLLVGGLGLGLSYWLSTSGAENPLRLAGLELLYAPAVLLLGALVVGLFGWRPGWVAVGWVAVGVCYVLGWLGELLDIPDWVVKVSPFSHVPRVPVVAVTWSAVAWTALGAVLLALVGWAGFRRRDIG